MELIVDPKAKTTAAEREENHNAVMRTYKMQEDLAKLMDSVLYEQKQIKDLQGEAPVIKEYYDSLEAIRSELVPVKTGRTVLFADEEKLRDKISDIYFGVTYSDSKPTTSQNDGLNKLQRDMNTVDKKLVERKKTYRPKVKEALNGKAKHEAY